MRLTIEQLEPRLALHGTLHELQTAGASRDDVLHCLTEGCQIGPTVSLPHHDNAEMQAEHLYLLGLVPVSAADGVTRIVVPAGETLTIDGCLSAEWIRVQGTLEIVGSAHVLVDTIITDPGSTLIVTGGTVTFVDGALRADDPLQMSRGLIAHGTVSIHGTAKTPFSEAVTADHGNRLRLQGLSPGAAQLSKETVVIVVHDASGWNVGDQLVIPGTVLNVNQDDERTIAAIDGNLVTLDRPLSFDHPTLLDHPPVVANLTRSVVFESENPAGVRGHVMMMHNASRVDIAFAAFENLGRTRADVVVTDPKIDGTGGGNPRGRYALHFHRGGTSVAPGQVVGSVATGAKKLGFVNHSSSVIVDQSIAYRFDGSGFFTETGEETGEFRNNLAIRTTNLTGRSSQEVQVTARRNAFDLGFSGNGYWLQAGGVEMVGNAFYGVNTGVFVFPGQAGVENGRVVQFKRENLPVPDPTAPATFGIGRVPFTIYDTFGAGAHAGIVSYHGGTQAAPYGRWNQIHHADLVNVTSAISLNYTSATTVQHIRAIGNIARPAGIAFAGNGVEDAAFYSDVSAEGFVVGFRPPHINGFVGGDWDLSVQRAFLRCLVGIAIRKPYSQPLRYRFEDVTFGVLPAASLIGTGYYDWPRSIPVGQQVEYWQDA